MDNAVVIGYGVVGKAVAKHFAIKKYFDMKGSNVTLEEVSKIRYVFICLPTPVTNGRYKTDDIFAVVKQIVDYGSQNVFIIKSTVFPGFADHLMNTLGINSVVSCPEFLSEDSADEDMKNPPFIVVGGRLKNYIDDVVAVHKSVDRRSDVITTNNVTAEMIKQSLNAFFSTKVVFANQIYDYCQTVNANYETVKKVMQNHKWVGKNHFEIFHKGGRGAGGKCLKKDLEAFAETSNLPLMRQISGINNSYLHSSGKQYAE